MQSATCAAAQKSLWLSAKEHTRTTVTIVKVYHFMRNKLPVEYR
jgi:hypothetical protein